MRIIVHISDLHFNRIDTGSLKPMLRAIKAVKPNLVIISGDFTQRARTNEFEAATDFVKKLKQKTLVVPGNHDIRPLFSPLKRIFDPYDRYKKYISENLTPTYIDEEIAVAGLNTVRSAAFKDGRVNKKQINTISEWFKPIDNKKVKIVVSHHPFQLPEDWSDFRLARKAKMAVEELSSAGVDLYLSGHYHHSSITHTAERYHIDNYSALAVQAGTVSNRQRREVQSFNLIFIEHPMVRIDTYLYDQEKKRFDLYISKEFIQTGKEWKEKEAIQL